MPSLAIASQRAKRSQIANFADGEQPLILNAASGVLPMSSTRTAVRLSRADRAGIRNAVETACGEVGAVWRSIVLFGSRVDPQRHGGDIDLLISLNPSDPVDTYRFTQRLRLALEDQLGDQRIDLVIDDGQNSSPFIALAKKVGRNVVEAMKQLLQEQLALMQAAAEVLGESRERVAGLGSRLGGSLNVDKRESCEALPSRFARLNDFLMQRVFRTLDQIELLDDGTPHDRLQRAEARGLSISAGRWRELRMLRNAIAHDYLIESADRVLREAFQAAPELFNAVDQVSNYVTTKGYRQTQREV